MQQPVPHAALRDWHRAQLPLGFSASVPLQTRMTRMTRLGPLKQRWSRSSWAVGRWAERSAGGTEFRGSRRRGRMARADPGATWPRSESCWPWSRFSREACQ